MVWVQARLWDAYSGLTAAHARLPPQRRVAELDDVAEPAVRELVNTAERLAEDALSAETATRAAMERESDDSAALSDRLHALTMDLMATLWHAHEVAVRLAAA